MLETRTMNQFDVVTVETERPKSVRNLEVKVYKVEWRWWWDASSDNLSNYNADNATTSCQNLYNTMLAEEGMSVLP
jgi:hypothetical protein